jgi:hypothetical protein
MAHPCPEADPAVSRCLDVCLADGTTVFVIFPEKITTQVRGTYAYWNEPLGDKLLLDFERLQRRGEPPDEFVRQLPSVSSPEPQADPYVDLIIQLSGFSDRRRFRQRADAPSVSGCPRRREWQALSREAWRVPHR